jgi:hypothetical protein
MSSIMWSLKVKLWTSRTGFISYLMIILPIVIPMVNPWKNIIFSHMHTLLFALMKTTNKHSLPLPSKQPTCLEQYSPLSFKHPTSHKHSLQWNTQLLFQNTHLSLIAFKIQKLWFEPLGWWKVKAQTFTLPPFITKILYTKSEKVIIKMTFGSLIIQNSSQELWFE